MQRNNGAWAYLCLLALFLLLWGMALLLPPAAVETDAIPPEPVEVPFPSQEEEVPGPSGEGEKLLALTFDDGPRRLTTQRLLDGLAQRGVKATFFLIGRQIEGNEDLLHRMEEEGHEIGIHTYDHVPLTGLNAADFDAQVGRTRTLLEKVLGHGDFLLRPPYGMTDPAAKNRAGSPLVLWSVDPEDWRDRDAERVWNHIVQNAQDGDIILLHDIFPQSVDAALEAVDRLLAQGYHFCTVGELFAARRIELKNGRAYTDARP